MAPAVGLFVKSRWTVERG